LYKFNDSSIDKSHVISGLFKHTHGQCVMDMY